MPVQTNLEEARYLLIHDDRYLDAFLDRDEDALGLCPRDLDELLRLDTGDVLWTARGKRVEIRQRLRPAFDLLFQRWRTYMRDDAAGTGLVSLFLRSADYRTCHDGSSRLHAAFRSFARRTGVFSDTLIADSEALAAK